MRADLIEAYVGRREDRSDFRRRYDEYVKSEGGVGPLTVAVMSYEGWLANEVRTIISSASPRERLEEYLEWNGIFGYTSAIYDIATNEGGEDDSV